MSPLTVIALAVLAFWAVSLVAVAVLFRQSATALPPAAPVDELPPPMSVVDVDIALLQISVVPPSERTEAEWEDLDRLLDRRMRVARPVPVIPGRGRS